MSRGPRGHWTPARPGVLVVACSDGRLQEATDAFLGGELGLTQFDRFFVPGGAGALAASGRDFIRAHQLRRECQYLVELHAVERVILMFHGPAADGPLDAVCADYKRKLGWASPAVIRAQQEKDAADLLLRRPEWASSARVFVFRASVDSRHAVSFERLADDAG